MKKIYQAFSYKHFIACIAFIGCAVFFADAQSIFTNPITNSNPSASNPFTTGQTVNANISVSGIGRGSGIGANAGTDRYNANSWNTPSLDATAYFEWTITPNAGFEIDFVSFVYTGQASGTGPNQFAFRSSLDAYTTNIGTPTAGGTTINLGSATFQNITSAITFRLYAWGASSSAGTYSVNDFTFNGTVNGAVVTPTVTIAAQDASAAEAGANSGTFRITRTGSTAASLSVNYTVSGTATNGTDYTPSLNGTATISSGQSFTDITITPVDDALIEGNETATLTLIDAAAYDLGTPQTATVTIADNDMADVTPPTVTINQGPMQADPTSTAPITFAVVFSEPVTGFDAADVSLSSTAGVVSASVTGGPSNYTVEVNGMTQTGTVTATVLANAAQDNAGNLSQASTSTDNTVTFSIVDDIAPTVTINQANNQTDPTCGNSILFTVQFTEPVSGFTSADVSLTGTAGATTALVTGGPANYTVEVSGMTQAGTVTATVVANAVQDNAGNSNTASTSSDNTVIYLRPTATLSGDTTLCQGQSASVTINVAGAFANQNITGNITNGTLDVNFSGTTNANGSATIQISNLTQGGTYTIEAITIGANCPNIVTGGSAIITVQQSPVVTITTPNQTACTSKRLALSTLGASITLNGNPYTGTWSIQQADSDGVFVDANNNTAPTMAFGTAVAFIPGTNSDTERGFVSLVLTSTDPAGPCTATSATARITIVPVRCGEFPWDGDER